MMIPCTQLSTKLLSLLKLTVTDYLTKAVCTPACVPAFRTIHVSSSRKAEVIKLNFRKEITDVTRDTFPLWDNRSSGDRDSYQKIDRTRLRPGFNKCEKQLKDAHPDVRKLCSLEYALKDEVKAVYTRDLLAKVQRFASDTSSIEARIARLTANIRFGQTHVTTFPLGTRDGRGKSILSEAVSRRRKYLKRLREWDYNKFCWVLETLKLDFPSNQCVRKATNKEVARLIVVKQAMEVRRDKFKQYHETLKAKQVKFLTRKESELQAVADEEKQINEELERLKSEEKQYQEESVKLRMTI